MSSKSKISWTDATWSPVVGCTKCSPGCLNCYAERMAIRLNGIFAARGDTDNWAKMSNILKWDTSQPEKYEFGKATGWNGQIELFYSRLDKPLHWRNPRRIFVCSMSDLWHPKVPFEFIDKVFVTMRLCPLHTFQLLTKRPERMKEYFDGLPPNHCGAKPLYNLHLGVSISTQKEADEKIPILLQIPAAVRFVSLEPMLEEIDLFEMLPGHYWYDWEKGCLIHQVIIGAESINGKLGRLGNFKSEKEWLDAARDIVAQCKAAGVASFVKQIPLNGKLVRDISKFPKDLQVQEYPK